MVSRSTGPSTSSSPSLPDNRLEQMREQQIKQLQEMQLAHSRDEAERVLDNVARKLQANNAGQRVGGTDPGQRANPQAPGGPDPQQSRGRNEPVARVPGTSQGGAPTSTAPATANPVSAAPPSSSSTPGGPATSGPPPPPPSQRADLGRLIADFQRQNGLPVTGKLDASTVTSMRETGVLDHSRASSQQPPSSSAPKSAPRPEDTAAARQARSAVDQQARQRMEGPPASAQQPGPRGAQVSRELSTREPRDATAKPALSNRDTAPTNQADKVLDPARLLASLVAMGFGKQGTLEEKLKAFQQSQGLPPTGKADAATVDALEKHSASEATAEPKKTTTDKPVESKQQVRRALNEQSPTTKNVADKDVTRDPLRPQAPTNKPTTSSEVAARAPSATASEAASAEKARLDSVLAQQSAAERGVQEGTGDPKALVGHGEVQGEGAGQKGKGGVSGGGTVEGAGASGAAAPADGPEGDETAVGNASAGDDDFSDDERGNANTDADADNSSGRDADGNLLPGFWEVPPLSLQVRAALNAIARDDDGSGPVTYTWDVTFLQPGVYADGQPGQELWHVAVNRATAFDPVWQTAADAIASRMLYAEPDAQPPTIDDFILALRRARVR